MSDKDSYEPLVERVRIDARLKVGSKTIFLFNKKIRLMLLKCTKL